LPWGEQKRQNLPRVKYWEIIADNLSKAGWTWGLRLNSGFQRANNLDWRCNIAATESDSSPDERRNLNELAFESDRRESDKRNLLPFQFNSRSLIGKR
jgi:hypothetical protein